jgi:hypothetical protein
LFKAQMVAADADDRDFRLGSPQLPTPNAIHRVDKPAVECGLLHPVALALPSSHLLSIRRVPPQSRFSSESYAVPCGSPSKASSQV